MTTTTVILAGATGNLGERTARALLARGAAVRALVRASTPGDRRAHLRELGCEVVEVDYNDAAGLAAACKGGSCVVSTLAGLRNVIVDAQTQLLNAAVAAGVPRFLPSDFSIDFTKFAAGDNRNLDLRREFHAVLDRAPIQATSIMNGAFTDMLTGQAPFILAKRQRTLAWGNADQLMDFTTVGDTAVYTAAAALDDTAPRFLNIAGDQQSARSLAAVMTDVTGTRFTVLRPGPLSLFKVLIRVARALMPTSDDLYPPWQGMQYMHNMFAGQAKHSRLDNDRYGALTWTSAKDVLSEHHRTRAQTQSG